MTINLVLPQITAKSLKDQIITLLVEEKGLNAKEIYSKVIKGKTVSYQAIHKTLTELVSQGVLEKKHSTYQINEQWIKELKIFVNNFEQKNNAINTTESAEQTIEYDKLYTFLESMLQLMSSDILYKDCTHKYGGGILQHLWWPLSFDDIQYQKFKHMGGAYDSYIVVPSNTPVDKWLKSYYEKTGFKGILLNADYKIEDDLAIVGDYLIYIFFTPELKNKINQLYSNTDMSQAINKGILETILMEKTKIKVTIIKNKTLVKEYWEKLLPLFEKKAIFR
jgi:DNA-binding PadR family transcriptional regulator